MEWWQALLWCLLAFAIGAVVGFFIARYALKKHIEKNPPVNRDMIRAMFISMGRKPSEAQINSVIYNMNKKNKSK